MSEVIDAIIKTRETTADIFIKSLVSLENNSEIEIAEKILNEAKNHKEIYTEGWYSPPPFGIQILVGKEPFERLRWDSVRKPEYWPNKTNKYEKESVVQIYFSPVDRKTNMFGDLGFTLYRGDSIEVRNHIKRSHNTILKVAEYAEAGMSFSELATFALKLFNDNKFKITRWKPISSDPNVAINIGHTVTGSFESNLSFGNTFEEIKETIRVKRVPSIETENSKIPTTCAFTVESRLEDLNNPSLPSVFFHFIVCFDKGKKTILDNFDKIFKVVGMDYMNSK